MSSPASSFFVLFINYHYLYTIKMKVMKIIRLLLISVFLFLPMLMNADELDRKRIGFNVNEVSVGAGFTNDGHHLKPVVSASYLFGRHFDENWFAGLSASCAYSSFYAGYIYAGERVYDEGLELSFIRTKKWEGLHLCDFKGWNNLLAKQTNTQDIPTLYIVNTTGKIITTNMWGKQLENFLDKQVGNWEKEQKKKEQKNKKKK